MEGRGMKRIISVVLSCLLLLNSLSAVPLLASASEDTEYTELTFRDWGLEDQTATDGNNTPWSSNIPITSWKNVAISGELTYRENTTLTYWGFGANTYKDGSWYGLRIRQDGNGNLVIEDYGDQVASFSWKSLGSYTAGTTIAIRVTFTELSSGNVELGVSVNGGTPVTAEITEAELSAMKLGMMVRASDGTAITIKSTAEPVIEYQELTFSDWGLEDQTATDGNNTVWCSAIPITSWENVAISGDISFGVNSTNSSWRFGTNKVKDGQWHGLSIRQDGSGNLVIEDVGDKVAALSWKSLGKYTAGETVAIRVTFTKLETGNVELGVSVNNDDAVTIEITEEEIINLDLGMMIRASDGTSITITSTAEPIIEYQELTFSDWGLEDQTATDGNNTVWCSQIPITTWENVAISGDISFGVNSANSSWRFGTNKVKDGQWHGLSIRQDGNGNLVIEDVGDKVAALSWKSLGKYTAGETVAIRVTFTKLETENIELGVSMNNGAPVIIEITAEEIINLDLGMMIRASDGTSITIKSIEREQEPGIEYTELTFRDWGLDDQTATDGNNTVWCSKIPITSWENVAISGDISFGVNSTNSSWRFGTNKVKDGQWHGLSIRQDGSGNLIIEDVGDKVAALSWKSLGKYTAGETVAIRVTFTKLETGNVELGVSINNGDAVTIEITEEEIINLDLGMMIRASDGTAVTIKSTPGTGNDDSTEKPEDKPIEPIGKPESISGYNMITFKDFGISDRTVNGKTINSIKAVDLHGKVFKGKVTFPVGVTDSMNGILTFGGTPESEWLGLRLGASDNGLYMYEAANGANSWKISQDTFGMPEGIRGKEIEISLTFWCVDKKNVYVGMYVNDIFCGEKLYDNMENELGTRMMIYSSSADIKICSSDTPWMKFLKSDVKLEYFGFSTNNWRKELDSICN